METYFAELSRNLVSDRLVRTRHQSDVIFRQSPFLRSRSRSSPQGKLCCSFHLFLGYKMQRFGFGFDLDFQVLSRVEKRSLPPTSRGQAPFFQRGLTLKIEVNPKPNRCVL